VFGGWGLYSASTFFGIVWKDCLDFRVGPDPAEYISRALPSFNPVPA
jgi:hypothetical protein